MTFTIHAIISDCQSLVLDNYFVASIIMKIYLASKVDSLPDLDAAIILYGQKSRKWEENMQSMFESSKVIG